ncbi:MAG TPA: TIGR04076 family protein [Anaerolineae bacterium]|nr:TIGR04076 family protein [Anaerolineae bacterium]HOR01304.1 TIGR04076 family protein [Anaerolineae bacterium]HPL30657.1 TIGR04076 family protein [Anaerolineae bacterium]
MAKDPGVGYRVVATVVRIQGHCGAGLHEGDTFAISCHDPNGLCGFFYHSIFPDLQTFQFGGTMPWWQGDAIEVTCPDPDNPVTLRLERSQRE